MKKLKTMKDVLIHEIRGLYFGERELVKLLKRSAKTVSSPQLRKALSDYLAGTEVRLNKLGWVFRYLDEKITARSSACVTALLNQTDEILAATSSPELHDVVLIDYVQRTLHYNVVVYRSCRALAYELRLHDVEQILSDMLAIEDQADRQLNNLAIRELDDAAFSEEIK